MSKRFLRFIGLIVCITESIIVVVALIAVTA